MKNILLLLFVCSISCNVTTRKKTETAPTTTRSAEKKGAAKRRVEKPVTPMLVEGNHPRYDATGTLLTYTAGSEDSRQIHIWNIDTDEITKLSSEGDKIDPVWTPDGRIVFSSNRDGEDFDLWIVDVEGKSAERITNYKDDELQPTVASVPFGFYAVSECGCGNACGDVFDAYFKILFTRKRDEKSEIWFTSIRPLKIPYLGKSEQVTVNKPFEMSKHGARKGRVSPQGKRCSDPSFALDGLSAVYLCDDVIFDAPGKYNRTFKSAIDSVTGNSYCVALSFEDIEPECFKKLIKRYTRYPGRPISVADSKLSRPSISTNHILFIADADGKPMQRPRYLKKADWSPLDIEVEQARNIVWSPTGNEVAFEGKAGIRRYATDFYLQTVKNLHHFPEVFKGGRSERLQNNRFLVRPADHKEFYVLYDQLRYKRKPQFISVDVALQVFRDEFIRVLEEAERKMARSLRALTRAMMDHYVERLDKTTGREAEIARFYAELYATAWVPIVAMPIERPTEQEMLNMPPEEARSYTFSYSRTAADIPDYVPAIVSRLPAKIRDNVKTNLDRILEHKRISSVTIPGRKNPFSVDFTQFKIRGAYAENDLGGYFLSMNWLAARPLPFDSSLLEVIDTLKTTRIGKKTAFEAWQQIDTVVGSFIGDPIDATLQDVAVELDAMATFDKDKLFDRLVKRCGLPPLRDSNTVMGVDNRQFGITVFPKRIGLDSIFFRHLTTPDIPNGNLASVLDVFATLGNKAARKHAIKEAEKETYAKRYRQTLDKLVKRETTEKKLTRYASTDLYHSWLALLVTLATPLDLPPDSILRFARTTAYKDRQLYSALAGYTHLKHSAVLYGAQDYSGECDSGGIYYVIVERPLIPTPPGFVEPNVKFFEGLVELAWRLPNKYRKYSLNHQKHFGNHTSIPPQRLLYHFRHSALALTMRSSTRARSCRRRSSLSDSCRGQQSN